jgi:hypothetical protein
LQIYVEKARTIQQEIGLKSKIVFTFLAKSRGFKSLKANLKGAVLLSQVPYPLLCVSHALPEHTQSTQANATPEGTKPPAHHHHHHHHHHHNQPFPYSGLGTHTLISLLRPSSDGCDVSCGARDPATSVALAT